MVVNVNLNLLPNGYTPESWREYRKQHIQQLDPLNQGIPIIW